MVQCPKETLGMQFGFCWLGKWVSIKTTTIKRKTWHFSDRGPDTQNYFHVVTTCTIKGCILFINVPSIRSNLFSSAAIAWCLLLMAHIWDLPCIYEHEVTRVVWGEFHFLWMDESIFRKLAGGVGGGLAKRKSTSPLQVFFSEKRSQRKIKCALLFLQGGWEEAVWCGMGWDGIKQNYSKIAVQEWRYIT